ncbi:MAG: DUF302 domain-containing protein, partial [Gammaproteobacteria bacterium]
MKKLIIGLLLSIGLVANAHANKPGEGGYQMTPEMMRGMVTQSMQVFQVAEDVSFDDAVQSMQLRANTLNFKMVADLPLSEQVEAMGQEANPMRILAFCDALIANKMVAYNKIFAGFLPCRIAIITDAEGVSWIITMNMDMMLNAVELTPELEEMAKKVRDTIYSIVDAGVNGAPTDG